MRRRNGFTLVEILIVIGILAIVATVATLVINPAERFRETRDARRISDLSELSRGTNIASADLNLNAALTNRVYISLPTNAASGRVDGDQTSCGSISGLPGLPAGWAYSCVGYDDIRKSDGNGWVPINFKSFSGGSLFARLPIDPVNTLSGGLYYTYVSGGILWEYTARMDSTAYRTGGSKDVTSNDSGDSALRRESGTNLALTPSIGDGDPSNDPPGRYWVGGTGNWSDIAHWASYSGGPGGASVPTLSDDAYFDIASFNANGQSVTIDDIAETRNFDWTGVLYTPMLAGNQSIVVGGSLVLVPAMTITYTGGVIFSSGAPQNVTLAGKILTSSVTFGRITDPLGGSWTLQDNFVITGQLALFKGTLNANDKNVNFGTFTGGGGQPKTLNMGSGIWTLTGNSWSANAASLTLNPGASTLVMTGALAKNFFGGGKTYAVVRMSGTGNYTVTQSNIFSNLIIDTPPKTLNFTAGTTQTITGTFTANGSAGNLITLQSTAPGTQYTINAAAESLSYISVADSIAGGIAAPFSCAPGCSFSNSPNWVP